MAEETRGGGFMGFGYGEGDNRVSAFRDMFDGGGAGRAGETFQGGPLSGLLNAIGVRPYGYEDTMASGGYGGGMGGGGDATMSTMAPMTSLMPMARPQPMGYDRSYSGTSATPATAYGRYTPSSTYDNNYMSYLRSLLTPQNAYDDASLYYAPMQMVPGVMPAQVNSEDYLNAYRSLPPGLLGRASYDDMMIAP